MTVSNFTSAPLTFNLYAADAINTSGGGLSLRRRVDPQRDMGKWIKLPYEHLIVPGHDAWVVPFTIDPPHGASPGDHVGGIVAENTQGTISREGSLPVTVVQAVGVRVYGRVLGPLHPKLALSGTTLATEQSVASLFSTTEGVRLSFEVRNSGNTVLSPKATVVLSTPFGTSRMKEFTLDSLLPGGSLRYMVEFSSVTSYGHLQAQVAMNARGTGASASSAVWSVPWALLGILCIAIFMIALAFVCRYRRKLREAPCDV